MTTAANLFKARSANRARPEARLLEIVSFDRDAKIDGCFPGTMVAKFIDGPKKGQTITVALTDNGKNAKTPKVENLTAAKDKSFTVAGGIIHADNLVEAGGHYTATWVNHFAKDNAPGGLTHVHAGIMMRAMPVTRYNPGSRDYQPAKHASGANRYRTEFLHVDQAQATSSIDEARAALARAFEGVEGSIGVDSNRAVVAVGMIHQENGEIARSERIIWRGYNKGEERVFTVQEAVDNAIENIGADKLEGIFAEGGKLDIIPMSWLEAGKKTSEEIDKFMSSDKIGGRAIIDVKNYRFPGDGAGFGFAPSNVLTQHYQDRDLNILPGEFTFKGWRAGALLPLSAINTPSDPDAAKRYYAPRNAAEAEKRAAADAARGATSDKPAEAGGAAPAAGAATVAAEPVVAQAPVADKAAALMSPAPEGSNDAPDVIEGLDAILDDIAADELTPA